MKCSFHFLNAVLCATSPPFNVTIASSAILTWLAPPNGPTDCVFNYTINITNYSSSSSYYSTSNSESLILTDDLITRGHNYSFSVAVTCSTGQHGPWSNQLTVTYDGWYLTICNKINFVMILVYSSCYYIILYSKVRSNKHYCHVAGIIIIVNLYFSQFVYLFQPPPLIVGFPVLHYVVSYNTSDNSTLIHTQVDSSMTSYTVSGVPGVTFYITVFAVNGVGSGPISDYSVVNGENPRLLLISMHRHTLLSVTHNTYIDHFNKFTAICKFFHYS